jgi:hypothetical protein
MILTLLQSSPLPLTATELRTRLRVRAVRLADYEVVCILRSLRAEGLVCLEQGRWRAASAVIPHLIPESLAQQARLRNRQSMPGTTILPATRVTTTAALTLSQREVVQDISQLKAHAHVAAKPIDFVGPWGTFRKLLGYYADCIRNDEGCEASGFLQDYGERFIFLNQVGTWYPRVGQAWRLSLLTGSHLPTLIKKLTLAGEEGVLVLGYPFQVFTRPDGEMSEGVFVKPIFTYQLSWHLQADSLQVWSDDPWAEVNLDWLTYALKKPEQQRMFLSACGLMDRGQSDESFGDGSRLAYAPDLRTLAAGTTTFFGERIREPLRPESVPSMPLPLRPESGIYNRAILMIGNRTRYAKSLLKELSRIASCSDEELDKTALRFMFKSSAPIHRHRKNPLLARL